LSRHIAAVLFLTASLAAWNANYSIGLDQYKNTSTLNNSLTFSRELTETLSLNGSMSFTAVREYALDKFSDGRSGRGWLSWKPRPGLELSANFSRSLDLRDDSGEMEQDKVYDSGTGQIRYSPADWLSLNMQAGLFSSSTMERDSLAPKVNDGSLHDINATLNRRLFGLVNTNLSVTRGRSFGSLVDSGRDNISARAAYNFPDPWLGGSLNAEVNAGRNFNTYYEDETTRYGDSWGHTESVTLPELIPGIFMEMSGGWSFEDRTNRDFEPDTTLNGHPSDNSTHDRNIGSTIVWEMLEDIELNVSVSRTLELQESKAYIAGVQNLFDISKSVEDRMLSFRLIYTPGSSSITFHRIVDLYRTDTDGTWEDSFGNVYQDDTDNDELRELLGVSARIPLSRWFTLKGEMQGQRRETIYIMAAMSGESRRSSTYSIRPGYECQVGGGWKLDHSVKLSADYTTYFFPEFTSQGNRLSRRLDSYFNFSRVSSDSTVLGLSHTFWFRDQGRYENRLYSRTSETVNSRLTLNTGFHVSDRVGITPSYGWEYSWSNRLDLGYSEDEHIHHVGLRSSIDAFGGVLSTSITRSFRQTGTPSYWQASVAFNYLL
jgi:hypothetical protein